jgi:DNA polymerase III subunit alpha
MISIWRSRTTRWKVKELFLKVCQSYQKNLEYKMVATNDCHYIEKDHAIAHNILLLLSDKNGVDYRQLRYETDQVYFKSAEEMKKLFRHYKGAVENTLEIAEKIDVKLDSTGYHFPQFPIPADSKLKILMNILNSLLI